MKRTYPNQFGNCFRFGEHGVIGYVSPEGARLIVNAALSDAVKAGAVYPLSEDEWLVLSRGGVSELLYDRNAATA